MDARNCYTHHHGSKDQWEEHSILDDELDEIVHSCSLQISASPTRNHTKYSFSLSGNPALASCGLHQVSSDSPALVSDGFCHVLPSLSPPAASGDLTSNFF